MLKRLSDTLYGLCRGKRFSGNRTRFRALCSIYEQA